MILESLVLLVPPATVESAEMLVCVAPLVLWVPVDLRVSRDPRV